MATRDMGDLTVYAVVVDADTLRFGGSEFRRVRTCTMERGTTEAGTATWTCSECGGVEFHRGRWCPNCGAKVALEGGSDV